MVKNFIICVLLYRIMFVLENRISSNKGSLHSALIQYTRKGK